MLFQLWRAAHEGGGAGVWVHGDAASGVTSVLIDDVELHACEYTTAPAMHMRVTDRVSPTRQLGE